MFPDTVLKLPSGIGFRVCRSVFAAFLTIVTGDSKIGGKHGCNFTSSDCLSANELDTNLKLILNKPQEATQELQLIKKMCDVFETGDFNQIVLWHLKPQRPKTFDIQIPGSWLQRFYFVIASHAAYNPLMSILYSEIVLPRHVGCKMYGFPDKLAESLNVLFPDSESPGRFRIIVREKNDIIHIYEALSITENHLGDKSKELFDRIGGVKTWGRENQIKIFVHGLFDGDFSQPVMEEFTGTERYDEFISARELLKE